ncbi:hypothetical protein N0V94_006532 [Neodidymelliopsis sp. IMI 364377]|nr:hypothetical protein N0V94_006532 [Neodidymelliopsis sp. IMI 364377]
MLIFVPLGLIAPHIGCNDSAVFVLNCFAMLPLADMLCQATNSVASFMGETSGALVNVTMGNLTELVIFIQALVHRQYIIVRTSLLGSIVVNVLLVLGVAILTGEGREHGQVSAKYAYKPLIELEDLTELQTEEEAAVLGNRTTPRGNIRYPRASTVSPPLLSFTDSKSYDSFDIAAEDRPDPPSALSRIAKMVVAVRCKTSAARVHKMIPVILLIMSTGLISLCSANLVSSVDHFVTHTPISKTTVGLIILPIVGNAAELVSGIMFASRKQMDLAFAVSIGSAIQIALFVTPLVVLIGWGMDRDMTLHFTMFEGVTLITSAVLFLMLVSDGKCEVWKGVCLCAGYNVIA